MPHGTYIYYLQDIANKTNKSIRVVGQNETKSTNVDSSRLTRLVNWQVTSTGESVQSDFYDKMILGWR